MRVSCLAKNKTLGKYVVAPSSLENIVSISELLEKGYYLSGNATHLYIHPPSVQTIDFKNIEPQNVTVAFMKHTDGIYRVSKEDIDGALHLN